MPKATLFPRRRYTPTPCHATRTASRGTGASTGYLCGSAGGRSRPRSTPSPRRGTRGISSGTRPKRYGSASGRSSRPGGSPGLAGHLRACLATCPAEPEAPLFAVRLARRGLSGRRALTQPTAAKLVARACEAAGIEVRHGAGWLRNQTATLAREAGLPLDVTRRVLGHAESGTTERHYDQSTQWAARLAFAEVVDARLDESAVPPTVQPGPVEAVKA